MTDKVIIDSSVWIAIHRADEEMIELASPYVKAGRVLMVDAIIAEVLRGAKDKRDYETILLILLQFEILSTSWLKVASLAFSVKLAGFKPPLIDICIAQCVIDSGATLIARDKHFTSIASVSPFKLQLV